MAPSGVTATVNGWVWLGISAAAVRGRSTGTPAVIIGAATMKMISSTSITSTMGVMLISLMTALPRRRRRRPPPPPPPDGPPIPILAVPCFELAGKNGRELVSKAFEAPDHLPGIGAELVVGDNGRNGGHKANGGRKEGLGDGTGDNGQIGRRRLSDIGKGVHNAPDRAEKADERARRTDSCEEPKALFEEFALAGDGYIQHLVEALLHAHKAGCILLVAALPFLHGGDEHRAHAARRLFGLLLVEFLKRLA